MLKNSSLSFICIVLLLSWTASGVEYRLRRYPLFAATPSEFAKVVENGSKNIVFDPVKNRQFCAIEIEWFGESGEVKCAMR